MSSPVDLRPALAVIGLVAAPGEMIAQGLDDALRQEIEARIETTIEEANLPGLAIGIVRGDSLVYRKGFGLADRASGTPVTAETMFQIGSTTKTFTATLLAILVDRGVVSFDDPISKYLPPDIAAPTSEDGDMITLRQLATHTSGLPRQPPTLRHEQDLVIGTHGLRGDASPAEVATGAGLDRDRRRRGGRGCDRSCAPRARGCSGSAGSSLLRHVCQRDFQLAPLVQPAPRRDSGSVWLRLRPSSNQPPAGC